MMEEKVQQHVYINFCFRLGKTGAETHEMLQAAFGESCLSRSLSGIPVSKMDADSLKMTSTQAGHPPPTPRRCGQKIIHAD
jgi:hypothetical protein